MASFIIFGTVWGFALREWRGTPRSACVTVWAGVALLILASVVIGYGNTVGA